LCQHDAAVVSDWDTSERLNYKIAEYSVAVLKDKPHFHISFIMNVSPGKSIGNRGIEKYSF
jgi:uncharacterized Fe-S center protein